MDKQVVVYYDGQCNFCNRVVVFVLKNDPKGIVHFAPLQSPQGKAVMALHNFEIENPETFILRIGDKYYFRSDAALRLYSYLRFPWNGLSALQIIPRAIRDAVYRIIARNRYKWFGKTSFCTVPKPEWKSRFTDFP